MEDARGGTAVTQQDGTVTHPASEGQIVGNDHGAATLALPGNTGRDAPLPLLVLPGRGLVEDEHGRPGSHGRRDGDETLRLRREVARVGTLQLNEIHGGQGLTRPLLRLTIRGA